MTVSHPVIQPSPSQSLAFVLDRFADEVPAVRWVVAVAADGLLLAASKSLNRDDAERLAASAAGLTSLLAGVSRETGAGPTMSNLTHYQSGFLLLMSISVGSGLLVFAEPTCDVGVVSHAMTELINRVGPALTPRRAGSLAIGGAQGNR